MNYLHSLTGRLFKLVFGGYVILAIVVTVTQLSLEYSSIRRTISKDIAALGQSFNGGVAGAMWELDRPLLKTMAQGIVQSSIVTGVKIISDNGEVMAKAGEIPSPLSDTSTSLLDPFQFNSSRLVRQTSHGVRDIGQLVIYTDRSVALKRIRYSFLIILINSLVKTLGLWVIFYLVISRTLARPLSRVTEIVSQVEFAAESKVEIDLDYPYEDELGSLVGAMRKMQERLFEARRELDLINHHLEETVAERTRDLSDALDFNETILLNSPLPMGAYSANGQCVLVNEAYARLAGATREALLTQNFNDIVSWQKSGLLDACLAALSQHSLQCLEINVVSSFGKEVWVECRILPTRLNGSDHLLIQFIDLTDRKKAELEKLSLEKQLHQAQKMESLGVLAGGIAHDFNNILAVISGYSSLSQYQPEKAAEFMPEIEKASERAAGLCRQMLAYAGKTQFVESRIDMTTLLDEMLGLLKSSLPKNVVIKPYFAGDIPTIEGDASQLRQVVVSLITNASEAIGEEQGEIVVALRKAEITADQEEKDCDGKAITPGTYLCLEITDNGCGMDDEIKRRIFEPFYTTKFVGRGLGMSAVLGIITIHKGALQFTSQAGQGTTLKIYLPVKANGTTVEKPEQVATSAWRGSGTILLVEDEPQLIAVAKDLLEMIGFSVIEASNGIEAVEQYRNNSAEIRLVLTDIGMPLMNGYQLVSELKKINPILPIIVSSGFGDTIVTSKIVPGDIAGMISKPYSFDQLQEVVRGVVEGAPV